MCSDSKLILNHSPDEVEEHEKIILSSPDWDAFSEALKNPSKANKALKSAYADY